MKNLVLIIILSLFFSLSAIADSVRMSDDKEMITQEETPKQKEKHSNVKKKKQIDITVEKPDCTDDKSTDWQGHSLEKEKYSPKRQETNNEDSSNWVIENIKDNVIKPDNEYESHNNDFHKWANKTKDSITQGFSKKNNKFY